MVLSYYITVNYEFTLIVCCGFFFLTSIGPSIVSSQGCLIFLIIVHPTVKSETVPVTVIPEAMPVFGVIFPESWKKKFLPWLLVLTDSRNHILSNNALDFRYGAREKMVCLFVGFQSLSHLALDSNDILTCMILQIVYIFRQNS